MMLPLRVVDRVTVAGHVSQAIVGGAVTIYWLRAQLLRLDAAVGLRAIPRQTPPTALPSRAWVSEPHQDAVAGKAQVRVLSVDGAGGLGVSFQVVTAIGTVEELLLQSALQGLAAYP